MEYMSSNFYFPRDRPIFPSLFVGNRQAVLEGLGVVGDVGERGFDGKGYGLWEGYGFEGVERAVVEIDLGFGDEKLVVGVDGEDQFVWVFLGGDGERGFKDNGVLGQRGFE